MSEFWEDFRNNWDNRYWWADHPELRVAIISVIGGIIGLLFAWLEVKIKRAGLTPPELGDTNG